MDSPGKLVIQEYTQHYFSGNQARVYFDEKYVAEIVFMEYSVVLNKAPLYSYNDPYFKMVAKGNIIVQGNFGINFVDVGYLYRMADTILTNRQRDRGTTGIESHMDTSAYRSVDRDDPTSIIDWVTQHVGKDRGTIIDWYRNQYWGNLTKPDELRMHPWAFDYDDNGRITNGGFKITAMFGVPNGLPNQFTLKILNDVHVNGESMVIQPNGQGLIEQYPFFARNIDEDIIFYDVVEEAISKVDGISPSNEEPTSTPTKAISVTKDSTTESTEAPEITKPNVMNTNKVAQPTTSSASSKYGITVDCSTEFISNGVKIGDVVSYTKVIFRFTPTKVGDSIDRIVPYIDSSATTSLIGITSIGSSINGTYNLVAYVNPSVTYSRYLLTIRNITISSNGSSVTYPIGNIVMKKKLDTGYYEVSGGNITVPNPSRSDINFSAF